MQVNKLQVCFVLDAGFARPTLISLTSLLSNSQGSFKLRFYTVGDVKGFAKDVAAICKTFFCDDFEIIKFKVDDFNFNFDGDMTTGTFAKLTMLKHLEGRWLYIDGDTLILDDIQPLFCMDLRGAFAGVVHDPLVQSAMKRANFFSTLSKYKLLRMRPKYEKLLQLSNFVLSHQYFNAGVLLLDCDRIRQHPDFETLIDIRKAHQASEDFGTLYHDQCWFNHHLAENTCEISMHWNIFAVLKPHKFLLYLPIDKILEMRKSLKSPKILHFAGPKPWKTEYRLNRRNLRWANLYEQYVIKCSTIIGRAN